MKSLPRFSRLAAIVGIALITSAALGLQKASPTPSPTELQRGLLYADLWMQTSAEYAACCLQTYRWAGEEVAADLARNHTEEKTLPQEKHGLPSAVIMDLDETVLDNSTFQTYLYESGQDYKDPIFTQFMKDHPDSIRIVPGAKDFIERAESLGITVSYITNREEPLRQVTIDSLSHGGINVKGLDDPASLRLLMQKHGESIKKPRRDLVREKYHVLAYFGDQLGDFSDEFAATPTNTAAARRDLVYDKYHDLWGTRWFVLPNPVYGQWQMVLLHEKDPERYLRRAEH
jgi:5'-nucleotidase (lipoprotein e(P4) family)